MTASDGADTVSDTFNIVVSAGPTVANNAPTVANEIPNQTATAGSRFWYVVPRNTFSDADRYDTLTYTVTKGDGTPLPSWLTHHRWNEFDGIPQASDTGTLAVKVTASDGIGTVSDTFNIVVRVLPFLVSIVAVSEEVTEGALATFTLTAIPAPTGNITVNVWVGGSGLPGGVRTATIGTSGTGTLTIETPDDQEFDRNRWLSVEVPKRNRLRTSCALFRRLCDHHRR